MARGYLTISRLPYEPAWRWCKASEILYAVVRSGKGPVQAMAWRARGNVTESDTVGGGSALPGPIADWFEGRGWQPRAHQLSLIAKSDAGRDTLLIAPTGAGKTLAGFLPSLIELTAADYAAPRQGSGLHTLYISPLKALAVDIHRNLTTPVAEMGLDIAMSSLLSSPLHPVSRE